MRILFSLFSFLFLFLFFQTPLGAVDVSPSRKVVPEKFVDPPGKRWEIFGGDPKRIERANDFKIKSFEAKVHVKPPLISLKALSEEFTSDQKIEVTFRVKNTGKRTVHLHFPDAQRYDIRVLNAAKQPVYVWSSDKIFVEAVGQSFINPQDKISFREEIPLDEFDPPLTSGTYTIQGVIAHHPELTAEASLTVQP